MNQQKRILVAPLNWGLGHASRCIPIIKMLGKQGAEVILAADGSPMALLEKEFPDLEILHFPGLAIHYGAVLPTQFALATQLPAFLVGIRKEHRELQQLIRRKKIDGIISDNRYGMYAKDRPSILITHQLELQTTFFKPQLRRVINGFLSNFSAVWVPDYRGNISLAGRLSHPKNRKENLSFLGPLSRFIAQEHPKAYKRKFMVILSGPEPNRSRFERKILNQLNELNDSTLLVRGLLDLDSSTEIETRSHIQQFNHLSTEKMQSEIMNSELIVCRSGYSSIMDLAVLKKKALLIPTKGQIEQEYLSEYHREKKWFYSVKESRLNLKIDSEKALQFNGFDEKFPSTELEEILQTFLNRC